MREMTDAERAFVDRTLSQHETAASSVAPIRNDSAAPSPKQKKKARKKPWQKISNWAISLLIIPVGLTMLLFYGFMRVESVIGAGSLKVLSQTPLGGGFAEQAEVQGMAWLPQLVILYENKGLIVGGIFTVTIIVIGLILIIDHVLTKNKEARNAEKD